MKKILSVLCVFVIAFCFISCGPNPRGELVTDQQEIYDYFEDIDLSTSTYTYKVTYKETSKYKDLECEETDSTNITGYINYEEGKAVSAKLNGTFKYNSVYYSSNGKIKNSSTVKENLIYIERKDGIDCYVNIKDTEKTTGKGSYNSNVSTNTKTMDSSESYILNQGLFNDVFAEITDYAVWGDCYINGDNMDIIYSLSRRQTFVKIRCNGNDVKSIVIQIEGEDHSQTLTLKIVNEKDVSAPSDKRDYEGYGD